MFLSLKTTSRGIDRVINKLYVSNFVSTLTSKMYSSMVQFIKVRMKDREKVIKEKLSKVEFHHNYSTHN